MEKKKSRKPAGRAKPASLPKKPATPTKKTAAKRRTASRSSAARPTLTRESIVQAALKILDDEGNTALSMRRLGTELNVDPMAVYYHFPNKAALLDGIVEEVMSGIDLGRDDPSKTIEERLVNAAHIYREVLLAHPQAVQITAVRSLNTPDSFRPVEFLLELFDEAGFTRTDALAGVNMFARFVRGMVLLEAGLMENAGSDQDDISLEALMQVLPTDEFPLMHKAMREGRFIGNEAEFDRATRALIWGLLEEYSNKKKEN